MTMWHQINLNLAEYRTFSLLIALAGANNRMIYPVDFLVLEKIDLPKAQFTVVFSPGSYYYLCELDLNFKKFIPINIAQPEDIGTINGFLLWSGNNNYYNQIKTNYSSETFKEMNG